MPATLRTLQNCLPEKPNLVASLPFPQEVTSNVAASIYMWVIAPLLPGVTENKAHSTVFCSDCRQAGGDGPVTQDAVSASQVALGVTLSSLAQPPPGPLSVCSQLGRVKSGNLNLSMQPGSCPLSEARRVSVRELDP